MKEIKFYLKDDEYGWLSNFYPSKIRLEVGGRSYATVEHFYQSAKTSDNAVSNWIADAPKPYLAMKAGRSLREKDGFDKDWEKNKIYFMKAGLRLKFTQHPDLKRKLLDTGDAILHEDSPTDMFWGIKGRDMLGKLLMEVRGEL